MKNFQFSLPVGFNQKSSLIVGVSGGSDSIALLHSLSLQKGLSFKKLIAAHVNYGLRGRQSQADELLVRRLCAQWKVPLRVLRVKNLQNRVRRKKLNLQE